MQQHRELVFLGYEVYEWISWVRCGTKEYLGYDGIAGVRCTRGTKGYERIAGKRGVRGIAGVRRGAKGYLGVWENIRSMKAMICGVWGMRTYRGASPDG